MNKYNVIYLDVTLFISRAINIKDVVKNINYEVKTEIAKAFPQVEIGIDLAETLVHITEATNEKFIMIICLIRSISRLRRSA